jgi:hypothetical protein
MPDRIGKYRLICTVFLTDVAIADKTEIQSYLYVAIADKTEIQTYTV